jgi:CRP-like cAMP-binding protein
MADTRTIMGPHPVAAPSEETGGGSASPELRRVRSHENRLLASLSQPDTALLAPHLQVMSIRPGEVLQLQGHPIEYVYFPHEGLVSLNAMTLDGHMIQAASVGRAGAICSVLKSDVREGFLTAVALSAMRASRIEVGKINAAQRESKTINRALRGCRHALLLQLRQNIVCDGLHLAEQRVSRWILETADRLESDILPVRVTQEYVAQCLGIRRTTVTLMVRALQDVGAIRWGRSRVEILDRARIETMACGCYAALREQMSKLLPVDSATSGSGPAD